ncbi:MAG: cation diffusion facilitator family transporter [Holophagales bacterium]|nr:cation diffusion facilitator family transporter [Holophagales bacterium]
MASPVDARRVLLVSFLVDVFDVVSNLAVALITGSAVVFAEMAQGIADSAGSALLVIGERRARRPADERHPFGYAREAFFWGLLSAVVMLAVGGGLSAWRGYRQLVQPEPLTTPLLAIAVVTLAIATNGYAVGLSVRKLVADHGSLRTAWLAMDQPLVKGALLRDAIGTTTSVIGLFALVLCRTSGRIVFDALGALTAAVLMGAASLVLMMQARALITGQTLPEETLERLREAIRSIPAVDAVNRLAAIYAGSSAVLVDVDLDLDEDLHTTQIEALLDAVEERARTVLPNTQRVRILLNSPAPGGRPAVSRGPS